MDETMNTGVEVTTDVSGAEEVSQEITIEETSGGPSKTFVNLVVGSIATVVGLGAIIAWDRHKKKKAAKTQDAEENFEDDEFYEEDFDEDLEDGEVVDEAAPEEVEENRKK